jgi:hypothetical protein
MIRQDEGLVSSSAGCPPVGGFAGMAVPTIPAPLRARNELIGRSIRFAGDGGAAAHPPFVRDRAGISPRHISRPSSPAPITGYAPRSWQMFEIKTDAAMVRLRALAKVNERVLVEDD